MNRDCKQTKLEILKRELTVLQEKETDLSAELDQIQFEIKRIQAIIRNSTPEWFKMPTTLKEFAKTFNIPGYSRAEVK